MILIDASFWESVGIESFDGNENGNQYGFYNSMVVNGVAVNNQYDFFQNSTVGGVVYYNQFEWYKAIGVLHSEPIYDQYTFMQNVTFDGVNAVGNQYDFFKGLTEICRFFSTLNGTDQYYPIPTYTSSGNFIITFKAILGNAGNTDNLLGQTVATTNGLSLSTNVLVLTIDSSVVTFTVSITKDAKPRDYGVRLEGNDFILSEDGVDLETITDAVAAAKTLTLTSIARSNTNYLNALISDVKLDGKRFYKLNEDFSTTSTLINYGSDGGLGNGLAVNITASEEFCLEANGDWLGVEKLVNPNFDVDLSGWILTGTDTTNTIIWDALGAHYTSVTSGNFTTLLQMILTIGLRYKISTNITNVTDEMRLGSGFPTTQLADGVDVNILTAIGVSFSILRNNVPCENYLRNVSVKRILQAP